VRLKRPMLRFFKYHRKNWRNKFLAQNTSNLCKK
jgi:hypothetical protein